MSITRCFLLYEAGYMRILIIGGTRFIGPCVVEQLLALNHEIALFHRSAIPTVQSQTHHILGDRKEIMNFRNQFRDFSPDLVLDMIPKTELEAKELADSIRRIAKRIVSISSQDVYRAYGILIGTEAGSLQSVPIQESSVLREKLFPYREQEAGMEDYEKILVERVVMTDPDFAGTILRLPMVYGPRDRQHRLASYLKRMDDKRSAIILEKGFGNWRWSRSYVENVAHAITLAVTDSQASGCIFNVSEPDTVTMTEWISRIGKLVNWSGEILLVEREDLPEGLRSSMNTNQDLVCDSKLIRERLGFSEIVTEKNALQQTIEWERLNRGPDTTADYTEEDRIISELRR